MKKNFIFIFLLSFFLGFSQTNPVATDVKTAHFKDVNGLIHLVGSDAEFGVLTYTIVSLPTHGTLKDPLNSDAIISVGESLTGDLVTFVPHSDENYKYIAVGRFWCTKRTVIDHRSLTLSTLERQFGRVHKFWVP